MSSNAPTAPESRFRYSDDFSDTVNSFYHSPGNRALVPAGTGAGENILALCLRPKLIGETALTVHDVPPLLPGVRSPRVLELSPYEDFKSGHRPDVAVIGIAGYGQPPDVPLMRQKVATDLSHLLAQEHGVAIGYAHGGRGSPRPETERALWGVGKILNVTGQETSAIARNLRNRNPEMKYVLAGHSQGGQTAGHILRQPEPFGFRRESLRGAVLWNPIPMPHSQSMLTNREFLPLILRSLPSLFKSLFSGRGITFSDALAYELFFGEGNPEQSEIRRLLNRSFPAAAAYFPQTLTTGTSPSFKKDQLKGLPISVVASTEDQLMPLSGVRNTADYLERRAGADVKLFEIPGKHYSTLVTIDEESPERVRLIRDVNRQAMEHAFSKL